MRQQGASVYEGERGCMQAGLTRMVSRGELAIRFCKEILFRFFFLFSLSLFFFLFTKEYLNSDADEFKLG